MLVDAPMNLQGDLAWRDFDIPGGNMPVRTVRLHRDESSTTLLVAFPVGWERPEVGAYEAAEEFILLEGGLRMSGAAYAEGDWVYVPAGARRFATAAEPEALALARFSGSARWTAGAGRDIEIARGSVQGGNLQGSPFGVGSASLLHRAGGVASWVLDAPPAGSRMAFDTELLALGDRFWAWVPASEPIPQLDGRCFCRTFEARTTGGPA